MTNLNLTVRLRMYTAVSSLPHTSCLIKHGRNFNSFNSHTDRGCKNIPHTWQICGQNLQSNGEIKKIT